MQELKLLENNKLLYRDGINLKKILFDFFDKLFANGLDENNSSVFVRGENISFFAKSYNNKCCPFVITVHNGLDLFILFSWDTGLDNPYSEVDIHTNEDLINLFDAIEDVYLKCDIEERKTFVNNKLATIKYKFISDDELIVRPFWSGNLNILNFWSKRIYQIKNYRKWFI